MLKSIAIAAAGAVLTTGLLAGEAQAQNSGNPIDVCRETSDGKKERIRCLEAAITQLLGGDGALAAAADGAAENGPSFAVAEAESDAPTGLGAEQLVDPKEKFEKPKEQLTAKVVEFAYTNADRLVVFLDNGQVWKQTRVEGRKLQLSKKKEHTVRIKDGFVSGYRLTFTNSKKSIRVERIK